MKQENDLHPEPVHESTLSKFGGGSLATSLAIHGALLAIGVVWIFHVVPEPAAPEIIVSNGGTGSRDQKHSQKQRKAMASPNLSRVAAANVTTSFTLPAPENPGGMHSLAGLGSGGGGNMEGDADFSTGGPGTASNLVPGKSGGPGIFSFPSEAPQRVAYVLDFSITMVGEKDELMRRELAKSLRALPATTRYSVICFSGPVWLPGDEVIGGTVKSRGKTYQWDSKSMWEWTHRGALMEAPWLDAKPSEIKRTLSLVDEVKSIGGTDWEGPLNIAIAMDPPPEVVFFMTDGVMEQRDMMRLSRNLAARARERGVVIHTVSMMEPGAEEPMMDLAKRTNGQFTIVDQSGRIRRKTD